MTPPVGVGVIPFTTPVVSFGDFTTARIATLGINPSSNEFLAGGNLLPLGKKRLADNQDQSTSAVDVWFGCTAYFLTENTYWQWFQPLEDLLLGIGETYKLSNSACHLDLSPWATFPAFSELSNEQQSNLLNHDKDFLAWQVTEASIETILFNGRQVFDTISAIKEFNLEKVDEFTYTTGGRSQTSDLIAGEGPNGISILGWTLNLQRMQVTAVERNEVMDKLSIWLKNQIVSK